jgi:acetolactate synthase-1/2/3 large subunit
LDYAALAQGFGVAYQEIHGMADLEGGIRAALCHPGPVLVRVITDYRKLHVRWIECVRKKYSKELSFDQKVRFLARIGSRALNGEAELND